ncbi:uncharacterized protein LOC128557520 [Mercenaria mercenaria]|uniref:uncharacterized protein LOC128557520 n=1 Tax=Mercenaria mercenaria TaxID=6596 RepID=UPI00234E8147|nr:uncharacterized protein LOC128557520 [Mercenaria mercenaria]
MINIYKECKEYLNVTSNGIIAANIRQHMVDDMWDTFSTGSELCDCYEGESCYSALNQEIISISITPDSTRDKYQKIVALNELLCSNTTRVQCTKKGQLPTCLNILQNYNDSRAKIDVYTKAVNSICHIVNTEEFKNNKQCIIEKVVGSYQPCVAEAQLPTTVTTCRDFQKLYKCVSSALKDQCNGDYTKTAYEMIRTSMYNTIECDVKSAAFAVFPQFVSIFIFMFMMYFCVLCSET